MTQRDTTPRGSSFDLGGKVNSIVTDTTQLLSNAYEGASSYVTNVWDTLTSDPEIPQDTRSGSVPTSAEAQLESNEGRAVQPRDASPLANLPFLQNTPEVINHLRNVRHTTVIEENPFAVRLRSIMNQDVVAFRVSPEISETRSAGYKTLDPVHMPGAVQVYQSTAPRTWNIAGIKLISRNGEEAEENLATINQLRSWMMPFFGKTNTNDRDAYEADLLGSPPEVLEFTAYSDVNGQGVTNIRKIPVVMTTFNLNYPTDVDYIKTAQTGQPFPAVTTVDIIIVETHSPNQLSNFDLIDFRHGNLEGFN